MVNEQQRSVRWWWSLGAALAIAGVPHRAGAAAKVRVGNEFQVNTHTLGSHSMPSVAIENDGDFVVVWGSQSQDGSEYGLFGQRFNSAGSRRGVEFQVNLYTGSSQTFPVVAVDDGGGFVVAWDSFGQDGSGLGVFARRFGSSGNGLGAEIQANVFTTGAQQSPALAMDGGGDFVVAWQSDAQDGDTQGVFARRFNSSGNPQSGEFQVNTYTVSHQRLPAVSPRGDGGFVVVWHSYTQDGIGFGIFGRRFDGTGAALGVELQVNATTNGSQFYPDVATGTADDFVVTWESLGQDGDQRGVFLRRFDSTGAALTGEIQVNTYTMSVQERPAIGAASDGSFVVAWRSLAQDGGAGGVFAQAFDSATNPAGPEFRVNTHTALDQGTPDVTAATDGKFVVAWQSFDQDGSLYGVFAQRYADASGLDVDLDGQVEALTDGLLILRWIFGFNGATLVTGAVDLGDCTRCTAPLIETYLQGRPLGERRVAGLGLTEQTVRALAPRLDIDADAFASPLTDGIPRNHRRVTALGG